MAREFEQKTYTQNKSGLLKDLTAKSSILNLDFPTDKEGEDLITKGYDEGIQWSDVVDNDGTKAYKIWDAVVDINGQGKYRNLQDALSDGHTRIFIKSGTYTISSTTTVTSTKLILVGENKNDTILKLEDSAVDSDISILRFSSAFNDVIIENIQFDGNNTNRVTNGDKAISVNSTIDNCLIRNCIFTDFYVGNAIFLNSLSTKVWILQNDFNSTGSLIVQRGTNVYIKNNYIEDSLRAGIDIRAFSNAVVVDNIIDSPASNGIFLSAASVGDSEKIIISRNIIFDSGTNGIETSDFDSGSKICKYLNITNNHIINAQKDGIILDYVDWSDVSHNLIRDCGQITNDTYSGIILKNGATRNTVTGNRINSTAANKLKYGIREDSTSDDYNIITNNTAIGSVTAQISKQGTHTELGHNIEA